MSVLADILTTVLDRRPQIRPPGARDRRTAAELAEALLTEQAEITGMVLARAVLDRYGAMSDSEKHAFFAYLAHELDVDPEAVRRALAEYEAAPGKETYRAFMRSSEPRRQELVRRLNQAPGATARLVGMRADLHRLTGEDRALQALDIDFRHLFASWFNRGFLVLLPINWDSPARILEKIIAYEAVHAIDSWEDLRRRVVPADRRCFGFFHPSMPGEPLIFVEVALTRGTPSSVQALLAKERTAIEPEEADTAVFYSISNCQDGLAGISFGNSLIKQVVEDLSRELPGLRTFVTLSPVPGLARWMKAEGIEPGQADEMRRAAAVYLTEGRRSDGAPLDPVARFHLGNGAVLHDIHAGADSSANGRKQSHGVMVNYLYDLTKTSARAEDYATSRSIAVAPAVRGLAKQARRGRGGKDKTDGQPAV